MSVNRNGTTFYVDFERIRKHDGYVYWWDLIDYLKPTREGDLSVKNYNQGDCKLFRTKTLTEHSFTAPMGGGSVKVLELTKFHKKWMYPPPNTSAETILKQVCSR